MQIKLLTIPIGDSGFLEDELNRFLRGNKIIEVENHIVQNEKGAYWCFCIRYIERGFKVPVSRRKTRVDYKQVLDEAAFKKFAKLREIRKKVATEQGLPAFVVFTDEELAGLAKLDVITEKSMLFVKGIGDKKVGRFGKYFVKKGGDKKENHEKVIE